MSAKQIVFKIGGALLTLILSSMVIFALVRFAPGDPIDIILSRGTSDIGVNMEMLEERKSELREHHGLNDTIPIQYARWLSRLLKLDMGDSIRTGYPITRELGSRIPATLLLSTAAILIETFLGLAFGIHSAMKAGRFGDNTVRVGCVFIASLPAFVLSLTLLYLFAVQLHWYEISSSAELHRLWLPALTLGVVGSPEIIRMIRATMLNELGQPYVSAAVSRSLSKRRIIFQVFLNALLPIITTIAMSFAHLVGGAVVIESIFNWPGLGNYALSSILVHDYPAIQGYTLLAVTTVIVINLLVEIMYVLADPRVRAGSILSRHRTEEKRAGI